MPQVLEQTAQTASGLVVGEDYLMGLKELEVKYHGKRREKHELVRWAQLDKDQFCTIAVTSIEPRHLIVNGLNVVDRSGEYSTKYVRNQDLSWGREKAEWERLSKFLVGASQEASQ